MRTFLVFVLGGDGSISTHKNTKTRMYTYTYMHTHTRTHDDTCNLSGYYGKCEGGQRLMLGAGVRIQKNRDSVFGVGKRKISGRIVGGSAV